MHLKSLRVVNFKNIAEANLTFSPKINCILGNNGGGKTSLLDAIYYLSMTKSFFSIPESYAVTFGKSEMGLIGNYELDGQMEKIQIGLRLTESTGAEAQSLKSEKILKRNDKRISRLSSHIGLLPIVMVSPQDAVLINGSGEERRRFMNFVLSQTDAEYLRNVQNYNLLLAQRNKLLKMRDPIWDLIETISIQMVTPAAYIYNKRKELIEGLCRQTADYYRALSGGREEVTMSYLSELNRLPMDALLNECRQKDAIVGFTTAGPHRDDIDFLISGFPIKKIGSQGQQKSFLIALKLAQFSLIRGICGKNPILLLDDLFDKLDMNRIEYLLGLVSGEDFGQIFITDSSKVRIGQILERVGSLSKSYIVNDGIYAESAEYTGNDNE